MANLISTLAATPEISFASSPSSEDRKLRSKIAQAMLAQGIDTSPVQSWTQGAARLANAIVGGSMAGDMRREDQARESQLTAALAGLPGLGGAPQPASPQPSPQSPPSGAPMAYQPIINSAAEKTGTDPQTLTRVLGTESNFNPNAVSPKGAQGIAQFMPATAAERGVNPNDPKSAIPGAAGYLADLKKQFGGDERLALMAYNWGPGNVQNWLKSGADPSKVPAETQNYLTKTMGGGQPLQVAQAGPSIDPQVANTIRALISNPQTRAYGLQLYGQFAKPTTYGFQTLPDGTVVRTDPRSGTVTPIMQAPKNPTYGVISKDQYGNEQYGWIDPANRTTTPGQQLQATAPSVQSSAETTPQTAPVAAQTLPPPPPGADPKEWRKQQTKLAVGAQAANSQRQKYADIVTTDIDRVIGMIEKNPNLTTGVGGAVMQNIPGTDAFNASALADTIKANVGFDRLQEMRNASPTGGALGQVSEMENKLLQATIGNLALSQNKDQLLFNLRRVKDIYGRIINQGISPEQARKEIEDLGGAAKQAGPKAGIVEDGYRFKGGDPSKQENWERVQ